MRIGLPVCAILVSAVVVVAQQPPAPEVTSRSIARYIRETVRPDDTAAVVQERLRRFITALPNPAYADPPTARVANLRSGRALLVTCMIVIPPHHDVATIQGYREAADGKFQLAAEIPAGEFGGFNLFTRELQSPVAGEFWFLAWGQSHTGNGRIVRVRLYAFDGRRFRTLWAPALMFNPELQFSESGFEISRERPDVTETYRLTPRGVELARSR